MSEVRFTKGPWRLDHDPLGSGVFLDNDNYHGIEAGNGFISSGSGFNCTGFMSKEDASLIAAAPDLYAALTALAHHCEAMEAQNADYHELAEGGIPRFSQPLADAFAALSRARGE